MAYVIPDNADQIDNPVARMVAGLPPLNRPAKIPGVDVMPPPDSQPIELAPVTRQPSPWAAALPMPDAVKDVIEPAPKQTVLGNPPSITDLTKNPYEPKVQGIQSQIVANEKDKQLKPRWWERLIAGLSTTAQAYGNGGHATEGMMETAANINDRRRNTAQRPLYQQLANEQRNSDDWYKSNKAQNEEMEKTWERGLASENASYARKSALQAREDALNERRERDRAAAEDRDLSRQQREEERNPDIQINRRLAVGKRMGLKGDDLKYYSINGKLKEPNSSVADSLAYDRMEERRQKNLEQVQRDIDSKMANHKKGIQSRIDKVESSYLPDDPKYKAEMARIEQDDYAGMQALGQQFSSRVKRFGENVPAPDYERWENSFIGKDAPKANEQKPASNPAPAPKAAPSKSQPATKQASTSHQVGDVVTVKGKRVKITKLYNDGTFDGEAL